MISYYIFNINVDLMHFVDHLLVSWELGRMLRCFSGWYPLSWLQVVQLINCLLCSMLDLDVEILVSCHVVLDFDCDHGFHCSCVSIISTIQFIILVTISDYFLLLDESKDFHDLL